MEIQVALPTGNINSWEEEASHTIKHVKEKIQAKEGIPSDQQLLMTNTGQGCKELTDDCILSDCIDHSSSTQLRLTLRLSMQIYIETLTRKRISVEVDPLDTVESLKNKIEEKEHVPFIQQMLIFAGKPLDDGYTLSHYNIERHCTVHMVLRCRSGGPMQGEREKSLIKGRVLSRYNIEHDSETYLLKDIQIHIKQTKKTITITIDYFDTIENVKGMIKCIEHVPIDRQILTFDGRVLQDEYLVCDYDISDDKILHLHVLARASEKSSTWYQLIAESNEQLHVKLGQQEKNQNIIEKEIHKQLGDQMQQLQEQASDLQLMQDTVAKLIGQLKGLEDISKRLWVISRDEVLLSNNILGTGGWGYVTEATYRGRKVAAKCLLEMNVSPHNQELFAKEMIMSTSCRHRNLVEFIGAVPDHPAIIITELMDCTLRAALANRTATPNHIHPISMDVAQGLLYLHSIQPHPLIHCDVSAPNVLLKTTSNGWIAKLSNVGSIHFANTSEALLCSAPKPSSYWQQKTTKTDVYSFGMLLIEMLTREMPTGSIEALVRSVQSRWPRFVPLITSCTLTDHNKRPSMRQVIDQLDQLALPLLQRDKEDLPVLILKESPVNLVHVDGPYQIYCDGQIGGMFIWSDCGLELTFPPNCSQQIIQVTMSTFLPTKQEIHPGVYIVSAVYKFDCTVKQFDLPFTLRLQHCVKLQSPEDCIKMQFVSQDGDNVDIAHGYFEVGNYYGTLTLNTFCTKYVTYSKEENHQNISTNQGVSPNQNDQDSGPSVGSLESTPDTSDSQLASPNQSSGQSGGSLVVTSDTSQNGHISSTPANPVMSPIIQSDQGDGSCSVNVPNDNLGSCSQATSNNDCVSLTTQYDSSLTSSIDVISSVYTENEQDVLPWGYEWMLALPIGLFKLPTWEGIYTVYAKLAAWRKVSIDSIRADTKMTIPFFYAVKELEFDADGVATISHITSEPTTWCISCWPNEIKKKDVNKEFQEYDKKKDPYYIDYKLLTMISKSHITVTKSDYARNCQLLVKGIKPPLQVDLCIEHHNNLTIDGIIESRSSNRKGGPVEVLGSVKSIATTAVAAARDTSASTNEINQKSQQHVNLPDQESLSLLTQEAQMWELISIFTPKIKAHCEDLAYCMRYTIEEVEGFKKDSQDLHEHCKRLFVNWLKTDHGPKPKTYQTLLKHIKKIKALSSASTEIEKELIDALCQD